MKKSVKYIIGILFFTLLLGGMTACGESRTLSLSTPENVFLCHNQTLDDTTEYILKWDRVKNADSYKITAYGKTFTTTKTEYDLTYCVQLNKSVQIGVQALTNDENFSNSKKRTAVCKAKEITPRLVYTKRNDGTYEVSRNLTDTLEGELCLPDSYDEKYVTKIADYGFAYSPDGNVGLNNDYTEIRFPEHLFSIGENAFLQAGKLRTVNLPNEVTTIGECAFTECTQLKNISILDHISAIGKGAFESCESLQSVRLPVSLKRVSEALFMNCKNLEDITIPSGSVAIEDAAFLHCENLSSVIFEEDSQLLSIGEGAFGHCKSLKNITLPETLNSIGFMALGKTLIKNLFIPKATVNLEEGAFADGSLESISIDENNPVYKSVDDVVFSADGKTLFAYPTANQDENYIVPQGIESICSYAFYHCKNLKTISLPNELKRIGDSAFQGSGLTEINLPYGLTTVGDGVFSGCDNLTELSYPDSVTSIGNASFYAKNLKKITLSKGIKTYVFGALASNLELIEIPDGAETIEAYAFNACLNLKSVIFPTTLKMLSGLALRHFFPPALIFADVYYKGTQEEWLRLKEASEKFEGNTLFTKNFGQLNIYFYREEEPRVKDDFSGYDGNYWHYAEDGITPVVWEY